MKKKLLSLLLVLCMVIPMVPMTVLAADTTVTFHDVDGGVLEKVSANYGDLVECPAYSEEGKVLLGWDVNGDGTADYSTAGVIVAQKDYTDVKPVVVEVSFTAPDDFSTTMSENLPIVDGAEKTVAYKNNWSYVYHDRSNFSDTGLLNIVRNNGVGANVLTMNEENIKAGVVTAFVMLYNHSYWTSDGTQAISAHGDYPTGLCYKAEYDGVVSIEIEKLLTQSAANNAFFAIFLNDQMIWPTPGGSYTSEGVWFTSSALNGEKQDLLAEAKATASYANLKEVIVKEGDEIQFLVKGMADVGKCRANALDLSVTYLAEEDCFQEELPITSFSANKPTYNSATAKYGDYVYARGNWSMINHSSTNWAKAEIIEVIQSQSLSDFSVGKGLAIGSSNPLKPSQKLETIMCSASATGQTWENDMQPMTASEIYYGNAGGGWGARYGVNPNADWNTGIRYIAEYKGSVDIDITKLIGSNTTDGAQVYFAIFVNGNMVWPTAGGSYTNAAHWFNGTGGNKLADAKATETYDDLAVVFVEKGDQIELLACNNGAGFWSTMGNEVDMTVTYNARFTEDTVFVSEKGATGTAVGIYEKGESFTFPEYKGNNLLIFGGWDIDDDGEADYQPGESMTLTATVVYEGVDNGVYVYEKGTADSDKEFYPKDGTFTFPEYTGELLGFRGWDVNGDGGVDYTPGDEVTVTTEIAYSAVAIDLSFSRDEMAVVNNKLVMPFGWSFVAHSATNYANAHDMNTVLVNAYGATTGNLTGDSFVGAEMSIGKGIWSTGYPLINWMNKKDRDNGYTSNDPEFCWGQWGAISATNEWNAALAFTAPNPGYITINIDSLSSTSSNKFLAVFVDGTMVWPKDGGSYTDKADWYTLAPRSESPLAATTIDVTELPDLDLLENIFVAGGQKIEFMVKSARALGNGALIGASIEYDRLFPTDQPYIKIAGVKEPVILEEGERYTLPAYTREGAFLGWDADGDGDVDYMDEETITMPGEVLLLNPVLAGSTSFFGNLPTGNADHSITYNGGWKSGVYDIGAGKFVPFSYFASGEPKFNHNNKGWGDTSGMYANGRLAMSNKIMLGERYNVAVQYTAEMSGNITIDFNKLEIARETGDGEKNRKLNGRVIGGFAIYHNGVKIAPLDAEYYYYESEEVYSYAENSVTDKGNLLAMFRADGELSLDVKKGDTIEVRAFKGETATRMFYIDPMITYNKVPSKPIVTGGGVTVGQVPLRTGMYVDMVNRVQEIVRPEDAVIVEGFTLDIYASLNAPRTDFLPADFELDGMNMPYGVMLIYWSEKGEFGVLPATWYQNNTKEGDFFSDIDFRFQLPAIKAEDISTNYLVCPIICYEDGSTYPDIEDYNDFEDFMYSEGELFSVSKYASLVLESPEMDNDAKLAAGALLNYAAAVNEYFNIESDDFVFPDGEMPVLPSITPKDVYNLTEFDGDAKISGATLVIDETISMRIYVDSTANISGWALQMDEDASFETPRNLKDLVLKRNSKGKYYVDVEIPTMNFGDAFYFRVVDQNGDQQSGVLTYSVESYVARMQGTGSAELLNLLDAMLTLCKVSNDVA